MVEGLGERCCVYVCMGEKEREYASEREARRDEGVNGHTVLLPSHTRTRLQSEWDSAETTLPTKTQAYMGGTRWDVPASVLMYALP